MSVDFELIMCKNGNLLNRYNLLYRLMNDGIIE
jgi:hypothetical protein